MTTLEDLFKLYIKERDYETSIFGEYKDDPNYNVASFLSFLRKYLDHADRAYAEKWQYEHPSWLRNTKESVSTGDPKPAPVETYESLIKLFVMAGAALETFTDIDPSQWRVDGIKQKWRDDD